ncbi:MAG: universal stress protein [Candidatus Thermoplasmatota archaeon]|nr:universal stress protein [Candidatus Thermoplasmatota archaeon]
MTDKKRILVPTSGYYAAKERGDYIIEVAKRFDADLIVVHVRDPNYLSPDNKESEGWEALRVFEEKGKEAGVKVDPYYTSKGLVETLKDFALEKEADLILVGASADRAIAEWVTMELMGECDVPVLVVPQDLSGLI